MYHLLAWKQFKNWIRPALQYRPSSQLILIGSSVILLLAITFGSTLLEEVLDGIQLRNSVYQESEDGLEEAPKLSEDLTWIQGEDELKSFTDTNVTVINFWNSVCATCLDANQAVNRWDAKYSKYNLQAISIHAPEFSFETDIDFIKQTISDQSIRIPVANDSNYVIADSYQSGGTGSQIVIIDSEGYIRHRVINSNALKNAELVVQGLLQEAGVDEEFDLPTGAKDESTPTATNLFFGEADEASEKLFKAEEDLINKKQTYTPATDIVSPQWTIAGTWSRQPEYLSAISDGQIQTAITGKRVFVVASSTGENIIGASINGEVEHRAKGVDKDGILEINGPGLYKLIDSEKTLENAFLTVAPGDGIRIYQLIVLAN